MGEKQRVVWKDCQEGVLRARLGAAHRGPWLEEQNWGCSYGAGVRYPRRQQLSRRLRGKPTPS